MTAAPFVILWCLALPTTANPQAPATPATTPAPFVVRVLDGKTGAPCPNATVWAIDARHPSHQIAQDVFEPALARHARCGRSFRTGADGTVTLPADLDPVELAATDERGVAVTPVARPSPRPFVLTLTPNTPVTVRIVDTAGKPANVNAYATRRLPAGLGGTGSMHIRPDANGNATLSPATFFTNAHHFQSMRSGRIDDGGLLEVRLDLVAPTVPSVRLEESALPATVTLVAPACGELVVTVLDDVGQPMSSGSVHARALALANGAIADSGRSVAIVDGKAHFPAVAVGTKLQLATNAFLRHGPALTLDGPMQAGDVVSATLRGLLPRGDGRPVVTLRGCLLGPDGKALANCALRLGVLRSANSSEYQPSLTTAADGTFQCEMLGPLSSDDELVLAAAISPRGEVDHVALVAAKPETSLDLGSVRVAKAHLLCDVRAVDSRGADANAWFHVLDTKGNTPLTLPGSSLHSDHTGRVRAWSPIARKEALTVTVVHAGLEQPLVRHFDAGSTVVIPVPSLHPVLGRVLLANARAAEHLVVRLTPSDRYGKYGCGLELPRPFSVPIAADGSFTAGPVPAGTWHLQVLLGDGFEVALVENVVVAPDGSIDAARLRAIDLQKALREVTVHVDRGAPRGDDPATAGALQLAPIGEPTLGKFLLHSLTAEFRQQPVRVFVPTQSAFQITATLGKRTSPKVPVRDNVVRLRLE